METLVIWFAEHHANLSNVRITLNGWKDIRKYVTSYRPIGINRLGMVQDIRDIFLKHEKEFSLVEIKDLSYRPIGINRLGMLRDIRDIFLKHGKEFSLVEIKDFVMNGGILNISEKMKADFDKILMYKEI